MSLAETRGLQRGDVWVHPAYQPLGAGAEPQLVLLVKRRIPEWMPARIPPGILWLGCWHKNTSSNLFLSISSWKTGNLPLTPERTGNSVSPRRTANGRVPSLGLQDPLCQVAAPPGGQVSLHRHWPWTQGWLWTVLASAAQTPLLTGSAWGCCPARVLWIWRLEQWL